MIGALQETTSQSFIVSCFKGSEKLVYNSIVDPILYLSPSLEFYAIVALSSMQLLVFFNIFLSSASQTDVIYLDFRKDFDSVAQSELLSKLWKFGIIGNIWFWLRDYLSNRVQYVCIGQSTSPSLPVVSVDGIYKLDP